MKKTKKQALVLIVTIISLFALILVIGGARKKEEPANLQTTASVIRNPEKNRIQVSGANSGTGRGSKKEKTVSFNIEAKKTPKENIPTPTSNAEEKNRSIKEKETKVANIAVVSKTKKQGNVVETKETKQQSSRSEVAKEAPVKNEYIFNIHLITSEGEEDSVLSSKKEVITSSELITELGLDDTYYVLNGESFTYEEQIVVEQPIIIGWTCLENNNTIIIFQQFLNGTIQKKEIPYSQEIVEELPFICTEC